MALPADISRVSVSSDGSESNGGSYDPNLSADGRYVTFHSNATNLVAGDTNETYDVFVHDRQTGETSRISVATDGSEANGGSFEASLSVDGRYVTFSSSATNLVAGDTNGIGDIFVQDRQTGETSRISVATDGSEANGYSYDPSLSADGRYVTFISYASNLVAGDTNASYDVFVHDRQTGQTSRANVATDGSEANGHSTQASLSVDGRYVTFRSYASNLVAGDTNGTEDIFVHDLQTGETTRISVATDGSEANGYSYDPSFSADGRYVTFYSDASNLVAGDTNASYDIFVHDRQTGQTSRANVATDGSEANSDSFGASLSTDGRYVTFYSDATNLVVGDTNGIGDIFVHDRQTGTTVRVNVAMDGSEANGFSNNAALSADGRNVTFYSEASNLIAGDANGGDVFTVANPLFEGASNLVFDTSTIIRLSELADGSDINTNSYGPDISADGQTVSFGSLGTYNSDTTNQISISSMPIWIADTQDGSVAAFQTTNPEFEQLFAEFASYMSDDLLYYLRSSYGELYLELVANAVGVGAVQLSSNADDAVISADGSLVAFREDSDDIILYETATGSQTDVTALIAAHGITFDDVENLSLSDDGSVLVLENRYTDASSGLTVRDIIAYNVTLDSVTTLQTTADMGSYGTNSDHRARVSGDGRFVVFSSDAENLVTGDTNNNADVFLFEIGTGSVQLVSDTADQVGGNGDSYAAVISTDGSVISFTSAASNLVAGDDNNRLDVFSVTGSINIVSSNVDPVFNALVNQTYAENGTSAVMTVSASDADGDSLTYSLTGVDADNFQIDAASGVVTFNQSPDFEAPTDVGGNNTYNLVVTVDDASGGSAEQAVSVSVTDVGGSVTAPGADLIEFFARDTAYEWGHDGDTLAVNDIIAAPSGTVNTADDVDTTYRVSALFDLDGFVAVALVSDTLQPILVIRGTNSFVDALADGDASGVGHTQFTDAWNDSDGELRAWMLAHADEGIHIAGHSLGGAQAQLAAIYATQAGMDVASVTTFNSPGVSDADFALLDATHLGPVHHYISSGDVVSMAGSEFLPGTVSVYNLDTYDATSILPIFNHAAGAHTGQWSSTQMYQSIYDDPEITDRTPEDLGNISTDQLSSSAYSPLYSNNGVDTEYFAFLFSISLFGPVGSYVASALTTRGTAEANRTAIGTFFETAYDLVAFTAQQVAAVAQFTVSVAAWGIDTIVNVIDWTTETFQAVTSWGAETLIGLGQWTAETVAGIAQWGVDAVSGVVDWGVDAVAGIASWGASTWDSVSDWDGFSLEDIGHWGAETWAAVANWGAETWDAIGDWTAHTWSNVANWGAHTWEGLESWSFESIVGLGSYSLETLTEMAGWTSDQIRLLGEAGLAAYETIQAGLNLAGDGLEDAANFIRHQGGALYRFFHRNDEEITETGVADLLDEPAQVTGAGSVDGTAGRDSFVLSLNDDVVAPGMGFDVVQLGAGLDTVSGTYLELDGDRIRDFTDQDRLVMTGSTFTGADVQVTYGSAILDIDINGDGVVDTTVYLEGDYENAAFIVESTGGSTTIRVEGATTGIIENGTLGDDRFSGSAGNDQIGARDGADYVNGLEGDDVIDGGDGADTLIGGAGNDTLTGGTSTTDLRDVIYGGDGDDVIDGGYGNDELRGDAGNDTIAGGFGADTVIGGAGDDILTGSAFGDLLYGGDGADFVNGGFGHDRVNGGAGEDRFFHIGISNHGSDWIQDYDSNEGDVLLFGIGTATRDDFQVNFAHTSNAAGERSGDDAVEEAFVIYRPTGQIMWALVDGGGQDEINIVIGGETYDLLT